MRVEVPLEDIGSVWSYEIVAYFGTDGIWHDDIEYSKSEVDLRSRRDALDEAVREQEAK